MYFVLAVYLISVLVNAASFLQAKSHLEGGLRTHSEAIWISIFCPIINTIRSLGIIVSLR